MSDPLCVAPVEWEETGPCQHVYGPGYKESPYAGKMTPCGRVPHDHNDPHDHPEMRGTTGNKYRHAYVPPVSRVCGHSERVHSSSVALKPERCLTCRDNAFGLTEVEIRTLNWGHAFTPAEALDE